jgi:hypothetical protein
MSSSSSFGGGTAFGTTPLGTSPFYNVSSIIDAVLRVTGHGSPSSETKKRAALTDIINNKYQEIVLGRHWRWLDASYDFRFLAPYKTGTAYIATETPTFIGVGTTWTANIVPKAIVFFDTKSVLYHVLSVDSNTQITLENKYSGESIALADATAYTISQNQYKLPKETDEIKSIICDSQWKMIPMGPEEFRWQQSKDPTATGRPQIFSLMRRDTDDDAVYIEVWPAPDKAYQVQINYSVRILYLEDKTTCYPIIPDRYRACLYYATLAEFYYTTMRDPTNADRAFRDYQNFYMRMANDRQNADQDLVMNPARDYKRRRPIARGGISWDIESFGKYDGE